MSKRPISEILFEKYLSVEKISSEYEQSWTHTSKKPDYTIHHNNQDLIIDVTEVDLRKLEELTDFGEVLKKLKTSALRGKISKKAAQLADFADKISVIVIYPPFHTFWFTSPDHVYESLYGDLAVLSDFDTRTGYVVGSDKWTYTDNGKFSSNKNTNISAIATLRNVDDKNLGVVVFENCYAVNPLPRDIFCGPYDIRYTVENNLLKRVFIGKKLVQDEHRELMRFIK